MQKIHIEHSSINKSNVKFQQKRTVATFILAIGLQTLHLIAIWKLLVTLKWASSSINLMPDQEFFSVICRGRHS